VLMVHTVGRKTWESAVQKRPSTDEEEEDEEEEEEEEEEGEELG